MTVVLGVLLAWLVAAILIGPFVGRGIGGPRV